ncbi:MAG: cytidylate kinase family protein [Desulfococcaceae bacterium]
MSTVAILSQYVNESRKIAEQAAFKLGYPLVTMTDLVKAAAKAENISEDELNGVLTDISIFNRLFRKRKMNKLVCLLESTLCDLMTERSIVFCGYIGFPIFNRISHVLQVLVLGKPENDGESEAGPPPAEEDRSDLLSNEKILEWFKKMYGDDMEDPNLYDLCVNLWHMDESEGADIIVNTLKQKRFTPMTYSRKVMEDIRLALGIKTKLIESVPDVEVKSHDGSVYIYSKSLKRSRNRAAEIKQEIMWMDGVDYVEICTDPKIFQAA